MTGNVKLCCMILPRLEFVLRGREFQRSVSRPVAFGKTVCLCIIKWPVISCPRFRGEVVCPVVKDLICLSELPLIPILNQSEQSAVAEVFPTRLPYSMA